MIRFFTQEQFHNKSDVGSTRLRVHQLIKYWDDDVGIYQYGENPDVLIFQKVYTTEDYKFPAAFKNIKILDICDPDWMQGVQIKESVDAVDGVVTPTEPLAEFIRQFTDKPVKVIKDRFDIDKIPRRKRHQDKTKKLVWFGYHPNAELLKDVMPVLASMKLQLTVISNEDPMPWRWASQEEPKALSYKNLYRYKKYVQETVYPELQKSDICLLPKGNRPQDYFKSENKTIMANLAGLPVAQDPDELNRLLEGEYREAQSKKLYNIAKRDYDVRLSVEEYKKFIQEIKVSKGQKDGK